MLRSLIAVYNSWQSCPSSNLRLDAAELPPSFSSTDTCFAMYCKTSWDFPSTLVLLSSGEAALECKIGKSIWYLLETRGLLNSHQLGLEIKYAGEQGTWIEY